MTMSKSSKTELIAYVVIVLAKGTEIKDISKKMANYFGPCTRQVKNAIALISRAGTEIRISKF